VHELLIKGYNQYDIADALQISQPTISRDVQFLSLKAKEEIKHHIEDRLPFEYNKCLAGINAVLREAWSIVVTNGSNNNNNQNNNNNSNNSNNNKEYEPAD
jgi:DNA-binding transcriptional regulator LsrR (DeoR family)